MQVGVLTLIAAILKKPMPFKFPEIIILNLKQP